jgi:hypothetical protein
MTLCVAPLTNAVMSSVPPTQTSIASAVNNALSRLAGLLAVSLLALVLAHGFVSTLSNQLAHSSLPAEAREQMLANQACLHDIPIPPGLTQPQRTQAAQLLDQAFLSGFHSVMLACALSAWAGGLAVLLLRAPIQTGHAKGAPGLAFETWDPPSKGQSSPPQNDEGCGLLGPEVRFSLKGKGV